MYWVIVSKDARRFAGDEQGLRTELEEITPFSE